MKLYKKHTTAAVTLTALLFSPALLPAATSTSGARLGSQDVVQVAPDDDDRHELDNFIGNDVRNASGQKVGAIKDFIVDADSGEIAFAVVSSGGVAGIGDTLRLVPFQALERSAESKRFTTAVEQAKWETLPVIDERNFQAGRVNITPDQRRELAGSYRRVDADPDDRARYPLPPAPVPGASPDTPAAGAPVTSATARSASPDERDFGGNLIRASKLKDRSIRAGNEEVGEVDDIRLDLDRGVAMAVIEVESEFSGSEEDEFLVPLSRLEIRSGEDDLTTRLTRADFQRAQPTRSIGADASVERTRRDAEERLTPTGRTTGQPGESMDATLKSAARTIKQMWDAHPELSKAKLRVTAEGGKLVLDGTVPNKEIWERAKDTAESVIGGLPIENRISVEPPR